MSMRDKNKPKNRIGRGAARENKKHRKFAIAGILAALAVVICAGIAVITPAVAASTSNTGGFSMANVISSVKMFYGCGVLEGQNGTTYNGNITDAEYANIDTDDEAGYLSKSEVCAFAVYSADDNSLTFYNQNVLMAVEGEEFRGKTVTAVYTGFEDYTTYTSTSPWYEYADSIKTVTVADEGISPASMNYWFYGLTAVTSMDLTNLDTSNVNQMINTFSGCTALETITGIDTWDVSSLVNMTNLFKDCSSLKLLNLSGWDTSSVTNMTQVFYGCTSLKTLNLTNWDTSSVTNMQMMFYECKALSSINVSSFDTSNVTNMYQMFYGCSSLITLNCSSFDTSNVKIIKHMFRGCSSLRTVNVTGFDFSGLVDEYTYSSGTTITGRDISFMFFECDNLMYITGISSWDTSNVVYMEGIFESCDSLTTLDLSSWDTSNVTDMRVMFYQCSSLKTIYAGSKWSTASVSSSSGMFTACESLVGGNGTTYDSAQTSSLYARIDTASTPGYFTGK